MPKRPVRPRRNSSRKTAKRLEAKRVMLAAKPAKKKKLKRKK
ncbi:MAG TPA: hypothetical protein VEW42_04115 [Candidatus Eisenbacteria bacterium]|nr:hypothetical protein [Candidatus Eisenbacteria bacterium]